MPVMTDRVLFSAYRAAVCVCMCVRALEYASLLRKCSEIVLMKHYGTVWLIPAGVAVRKGGKLCMNS